ncbi:flap endonuclease-1 [Candidatus Bathyarchaeota archaeon]|nr:flap endonuclease-1 [Candidatus Bathyarchaeota archaeon]
MGVLLTPIIHKKELSLDDIRGKSFAVDAFNIIYQFLSLIRTRDGTPLKDSGGNITSHLVGLAYRTTRLISKYNIRLVFVFDGRPPELKRNEITKRRKARKKARLEYEEALARGDMSDAISKAVMTSRLDEQALEDARRLLELLGIPWIEAPSEGEAQAALLCKRGEVWASNSRDYDSLLFGTPRLLRYLTISGEEWLPSKGRARKLIPELIELESFLEELGISREQLIDLSILVGTDFNEGIKGIGPKTALKLIREHGTLEELPEELFEKQPDNYEEIRNFYINPPVNMDYEIRYGDPDKPGLIEFLVNEREFSLTRVERIIDRLIQANKQKSLTEYFGGKQ